MSIDDYIAITGLNPTKMVTMGTKKALITIIGFKKIPPLKYKVKPNVIIVRNNTDHNIV